MDNSKKRLNTNDSTQASLAKKYKIENTQKFVRTEGMTKYIPGQLTLGSQDELNVIWLYLTDLLIQMNVYFNENEDEVKKFKELFDKSWNVANCDLPQEQWEKKRLVVGLACIIACMETISSFTQKINLSLKQRINDWSMRPLIDFLKKKIEKK
jgi:hypothetical protein